MGEIEVLSNSIEIHSNIILYGDSASDEVLRNILEELDQMWNEPNGQIKIEGRVYRVIFRISGHLDRYLNEIEVISNVNPRNNYFRIEDFSPLNISWVDGIGSNTGYFLIDNLYKGSTTAAHEYGHSIGLHHPADLNLIGKGTPGIMYPRGTLVNPEYQYNQEAAPATNGGTINPIYRRVMQQDIDLLNIPELIKKGVKYVGNFTNIFHPRHIKPNI